MLIFSVYFARKRDKWAWGEDGERQTKESEKTPDDLLEFPAGRSAEAVSEHTVPGAAGESRAGGVAGTHADTGGVLDKMLFAFCKIAEVVSVQLCVLAKTMSALASFDFARIYAPNMAFHKSLSIKLIIS